ncbi:MAG: ABC transporter substrate-binding protein [Candidatus Heimdallarchaeota archaeon]
MRGINRKKIVSIGLVLVFTLSVIAIKPEKIEAIPTFFTLKALSRSGTIADTFYLIDQQLSRIGIDLDIVIVDWSTFIGELLGGYNFDMLLFGLSGGGVDPDFTVVYSENGSLNLFGYDTSMDWDECLGTGLNEWYMKQGTLIMPPDSEERVQHYWAWQQHLMDKICPMLPTFTSKSYVALWSNLLGYNYTAGIVDSWGKMSWNGAHPGQLSTDELVITDAAWSDLNPLFQDDMSSSFISSATMDPLIKYDSDLSVWPHLAEEYTYVNDTTIQITLRDGIKWQNDPDDNFTNEYLDIRDVYFTLYSWKYVSDDQHLWAWIKDMEIIDDMSMKIYIDGNETSPENDPFAPSLSSLSTRILPEHFLNQTQELDGVTPNITHSSWETFATNCFGTGLFYLDEITDGVETVLKIRPDSWWLDETITNDLMLNWIERFGFDANWDANGLNQLRIRIIPDLQSALMEFEAGKVDIESVTAFPEKIANYTADSSKEIQSKPMSTFSFLAYNMRENRVPIGNRDPCEEDLTITKGLAIRKAINYAIDLDEINRVIYDSDRGISYWPIFPTMGVWRNPDIIRYDYDLYLAKYYMYLAGYQISDFTPSQTLIIENELFTIPVIVLLTAIIGINLLTKKRKNKR